MSTQCPSCGKDAQGKFCSECGALLNQQSCTSCGNQIPVGGKFCNMCGVPVAADRRPVGKAGQKTGALLPWAIGAAALGVLVVALVLPQFQGDDSPAVSGPQPAPTAQAPFANGPVGDPSSVDLGSMSPDEAAGRLYNRVMEAVSTGDTATARGFVPMALSAYQMLPSANIDARYHVANLLIVANESEVARRTADTILAEDADHLLGLFVAAEAERIRGNDQEARSFYQHFLDSYDEEIATDRPEYQEHAPGFPAMREQATSFLAR